MIDNTEEKKEFERRLAEIEKAIKIIRKSPSLPDHFHNGYDSSKINFSDLYQRKVWIHHTIYGATAATAANYGVFYPVEFPCTVQKVTEFHEVAGTDGGAVTLQLEKLTAAQAPGAGVNMLASGFNLKGTANTRQLGTLTTTLTNRNLTVGDRLCMKDSGTLTSVSNVTILVELLLTT